MAEDDMTAEQRRADYQKNHVKITQRHIELLKKRGKPPTIQEVTESFGGEFHYNTVNKHLNELRISDYVEMSGLKALTQDILLGVANAARKGSTSAAKLYMQLVHDWVEKTEHDVELDDRRADLSKLSTEELITLKTLMEKAKAEDE